MRLECVGSAGSDLPEAFLASSGNMPSSRFNVTVGREYIARAMALWAYGLGVLVIDDTGEPNWKPIELFNVVDGELPQGWEFAVAHNPKPVLALLGYHSLIRDPNHHDDLIERKKSAIEAFIRESGIGGIDSANT